MLGNSGQSRAVRSLKQFPVMELTELASNALDVLLGPNVLPNWFVGLSLAILALDSMSFQAAMLHKVLSVKHSCLQLGILLTWHFPAGSTKLLII